MSASNNSVLKPLAPKIRQKKESSELVSSTTQVKAGKRKACAFHPTLGYAIPPPVPAKVARRNARERNRVKQVSKYFFLRSVLILCKNLEFVIKSNHFVAIITG